MRFTPRVKLISILLVILVALPSGISLASVFSSQYVPAIVTYEEPALRLSNYSITPHVGTIITMSNYNTSASALIETGLRPDKVFPRVNYSNQILLQSISTSGIEANLTFKSLSGQYDYLANFSVYFIGNGTFFKEVSLQSNNTTVTKENSSNTALFNQSSPIRIGIMFQPLVNNYTTNQGNSFSADFELSLNLFHVSGNNEDLYTQYSIFIVLKVTTV